MKKIILLFIAAVALVVSCRQEIVYEISYNVSLDGANTYEAGRPVRFNFSGDVDNIVFYSGETGHKYEFRNRYEADESAADEESQTTVENDKGVVIKNLQNYLHSFEYTWNEPGTYTVTFVGTNANYAGASRKIQEMTITIFEAKE